MTLAFDFTQNLRTRNNARIFQFGSFGVALGLFCLTPLLPKPEQKLFAAVPGAALATLSLLAGRDHFWADRKVRSFVSAEDGGYRQSLVSAFMGNKGMGAPAAQLEAEVIEDDDKEIPQILLNMAEMNDPTAIALCHALAKFKILAYCHTIQEGLAFRRYLLQGDDGVKFQEIAAKAKDLMIGAKLPEEPTITATSNGIAIDVSRRDRQFASYTDFIPFTPPDGLCMPVGVDQLTREMVWVNFEDSNCPHVCTAGMTGGGKSELLRSQVKYLTETYSPDECRLLLVDPKVSSFGEFADHPMVKLFENPLQGAVAIIQMVRKMEQRRQNRKGYKDIASYNAANPKNKMPRIIIFVEELKDLLDALKTLTNKELEAMSSAVSDVFESDMTIEYSGKDTRKPGDVLMMALGRIGQAGRSEGIHLDLCTQEPDKNLLDSLIGNLPVQIGLKLRSHIETNIVMPGRDAYCHKLMGKGDLLISVPGQPLRRCQSLFIEE